MRLTYQKAYRFVCDRGHRIWNNKLLNQSIMRDYNLSRGKYWAQLIYTFFIDTFSNVQINSIKFNYNLET